MRKRPIYQGYLRLRGVDICIRGMGQDGQAILAKCETIREGVDRRALEALALVNPILEYAVNTSGVLRFTRLSWEPGSADPEALCAILKNSKFGDGHHDIREVARLARSVTWIEELPS